MMSTNFLSGANSRLLPPSIPFRFFIFAVICYVLFWAAIFQNAGDIAHYIIGAGPVLGSIHLATLGMLTMTVIGAALQLLSVATRKAFKKFWLCRLISWTFIPGFMVLVYGMYLGWYEAMLIGGITSGIGLIIFFFLVIDNIRGVKGMAAVMAHCWGAMLSLLGLVLLGILLIMDMEQGFMADHLVMAVSHFILAVFGFMGLLAMGFSYILVPMFALSPAPSENIGRLSIYSAILALIMIVGGVNSDRNWLSLLGGCSGMVAIGLYLYSMIGVYRARMKKRLGIPFLLIRIGWAMLLMTVIWGMIGLSGFWPEMGHVILAVLAIVGWLLTFLIGVLQRILPFLSSMHTSGSGGIPMLASSMANGNWLTGNAIGHVTGVVLVIIGVTFDQEYIIRAGAASGFLGGTALLCYTVIIIRHMINNRPQE